MHAQHPVLAPTYNPELLRRADTLAADIKFLLNRLPAWSLKPSGRKHGIKAPFPMPAFIEEVFVSTPPRLARYLDRINALSGDERKCPLLLAHAYVRYLGDLSGGQIIGAKLRRAYGLDGLEGRRFYYFDLSDDTSAAVTGEETVGERKKKLAEVKNWYRRGMNQGGGDDRELKKALVREANDAFLLNTEIFALINPPPRAKMRYFEKKQIEEQRRRDLNPPPVLSLTDHAMRFAVFVLCALVGLYAVQAAQPYAEPYVKPVVDKATDWFEAKVVPWWTAAKAHRSETAQVLAITLVAVAAQLSCAGEQAPFHRGVHVHVPFYNYFCSSSTLNEGYAIVLKASLLCLRRPMLPFFISDLRRY